MAGYLEGSDGPGDVSGGPGGGSTASLLLLRLLLLQLLLQFRVLVKLPSPLWGVDFFPPAVTYVERVWRGSERTPKMNRKTFLSDIKPNHFWEICCPNNDPR